MEITMPNQYPFNAYDKNICLKFSPILWVIIIFLLRPYFIVVFSLVNRRDKMGLIHLLGSDSGMTLSTIASIPAILVIVAWIKRAPGASSKIRWIWKNGQHLLALSALITIAYILVIQLFVPSMKLNYMGAAPVLICPVILFYLYKSEHVRDIFSDFPKNHKDKT